ncbi:MAG: ABC transporter ATP-binding protein [bacterium]
MRGLSNLLISLKNRFLSELGYDNQVAKFIKKLKPPWKYIIFVILFTLLYNLTTVLQPLILAKLFEMIYTQKSLFLLNLIVITGLVLFIVRGISQYFQGYLLSKASHIMLNENRKEFIDLLFKQPLNVIEKNHSGHLISVVISNLSSIVSDLPGLIIGYMNSLITLIFSLGWIFYKDMTLGFLTILTLPLLAIIMKHFFKRLENVSEMIQSQMSKIITDMNEMFRYIKIVKSFNREDVEKQRVFNLLDTYTNLYLKLARISFLQKPSAEFIASLSLIIITWYSGYLVIKGVFKPFDVLAYWGYVAISVSPIANLAAAIFNTKVIFGYIRKYMETVSNLNQDEFDYSAYKYNEVIKFKGEIEFKNVSFGYDSKLVLNDVSLKIEPGQKVAIIGKSGIGKSTLVSLLVKFYKPSSGKIFIDKIDIEEINPKVVRENISILTQEVYIFNDSIANNVRYSRIEATDEEIIDACKRAVIHEDILSQKGGYDYVLMEDGKGMSGGQRQRIAIARIFLRNTSIVILDEPTSSLDPAIANKIINSIFDFFKDKTIIVISHNHEIVNLVDKVFLLEDGKIIEVVKQDKTDKGKII